MKKINIITIFAIILTWGTSCAQTKSQNENSENYRKLTAAEERVIIHKGTETPFTGKYDKFYEEGIYICKQCGAELYRSEDKFNSGCGWPSFDDEIEGAIKRVPDGFRTEIVCNNCDGHLGHVFLGEGFTDKDTRHCVNSISMDFIPANSLDTAYFAGGCFWGVEYYMEQADGVISAVSGYIGGDKKNPSYRQVSNHSTGHAEAVRVIFDSSKTSYEKLAKLFFEIHDPTQLNRQGPDVGEQYRSEVFYKNKEQKMITEELIGILKLKGYKVATKVTPANMFWEAEKYHQDYYAKKNGTPYCHAYTKRF